jgi:hypothetical protein
MPGCFLRCNLCSACLVFGISDTAAIRYCAELTQIPVIDASLPGLSAGPAACRSPGPPPDQ